MYSKYIFLFLKKYLNIFYNPKLKNKAMLMTVIGTC